MLIYIRLTGKQGLQHVNGSLFPGTHFFDMDPETVVGFDGQEPGTLTISGYNEEYRQQQFLVTPRLLLSLESQNVLPIIPLEEIVQGINDMLLTYTQENTTRLTRLLGNTK